MTNQHPLEGDSNSNSRGFADLRRQENDAGVPRSLTSRLEYHRPLLYRLQPNLRPYCGRTGAQIRTCLSGVLARVRVANGRPTAPIKRTWEKET
jgi:hypothetical protein